RDASAVNSTRWALFQSLKRTGLSVETGSGGRTKWNRTRFGLSKTHSLDAACVGNVDKVTNGDRPVLSIKATGRGSYQRTRLDAFGFPRGFLTRKKDHFGFVTGDLVRAVVTTGKNLGDYTGRVAIRSRGYFNIQCNKGLIKDVSARFCRRLQRADGYGYAVHH
ncbi:MAG: RNA-guided endonuclease IscB, partial [Leptospirillum sp.]